MCQVGDQGLDDVSHDKDFRLVESMKYYEDNKNDSEDGKEWGRIYLDSVGQEKVMRKQNLN